MIRWCLLLLLMQCGIVMAGETQQSAQAVAVKHGQQRYVYPDPEIPTLADAPPHANQPNSDSLFEQRLWKMLGTGQLDKLQRAIDAHQSKIPGWRPPPWLTVELARAKLGARINAARPHPKQLLVMFNEHPEVFTCREYYNLWSLADAYQTLGQPLQAAELHEEILASCKQPKVLMTTLDRVAASEGVVIALDHLDAVQKRSGIHLPKPQVDERIYHWHLQQAVTLRQRGDNHAASQQLEPLGSEIVQRRDLDAARLLAWCEHDAGNFQESNRWLEQIAQWSGTEDDRLIALQMRAESGEQAAVIDWLQHNTLATAKARQWAADFLRGAAAQQFNNHDYETALQLLSVSQRYSDAPSFDNAMLSGWSNYKLQRYVKAQQAFEEGYRHAAPEQRAKAAEGVLLSAQQSGDWQGVSKLAQSVGAPLLGAEGEQQIVTELQTGTLTPEQIEVTDGHLRKRAYDDEGVVLAAGPGWLQRHGSGLAEYTLWRQPLVAWQWGGDALFFYGRIDHYRLTSQSPADGVWLGSGRWQIDAPLQAAQFNAEGSGELLLGLRSRETPWFAELGRSADGGAVNPTWLGRFGYAKQGKTGGLVAALYRKPRYDSLLSYTGMIDPYSGTRWGRVMEQGAVLDGYRPIAGSWQLGVHLSAFVLNGAGVADNSGGDLYLTLHRPILHDSPGDSLQAGPYLYLTGYRDDLSHYSLGQGGYYSPQYMEQAGFTGEWLRQRDGSVVRVSASAGYQVQHEAAAPLYPLSDSAPYYAADDSRGAAGQISLSWVAALGSSRWQWAGAVAAMQGPAFGQREGWLFLRYRFDSRARVRTEDLPERWPTGLPGHF